jgi:3-isopropylmalate/(R)-2-methylmalate dehydratase large subunit
VHPLSTAAGTPIDYADLGGHGGGRLEDFRSVAEVLDQSDEPLKVPLNLVPSSRAVFTEALAEGLVERLHARGGSWFPPSTGANQSFNMGALSPGEAMITTQSRNFPGRNGSPDGSVYLASARSVARAALAGRIVAPEGDGDD